MPHISNLPKHYSTNDIILAMREAADGNKETLEWLASDELARLVKVCKRAGIFYDRVYPFWRQQEDE